MSAFDYLGDCAIGSKWLAALATNPPYRFVPGSALAPSITSLDVTTGPLTGGTSVTITGVNFTGASLVTFNGRAVGFLYVLNDTTIQVTTPAGLAAGAIDVRVVTPQGIAKAAGAFTYASATVTVTATSTPLGDTLGGAAMFLTGTSLATPTAVTFTPTGGGTPVAAASFVGISSTKVLAIAPALTAGTYHVNVTTASGTGTLSSGFEAWSPSAISPSCFVQRGGYLQATDGTGAWTDESGNGRNLAQSTAASIPAEVGLAPTLDGADDHLTGSAASNFFTTGAGTLAVLFAATSAATTSGSAADPALMTDTGGYFGLNFSTGGVQAFAFDTAARVTPAVAASTNEVLLAIMRWNGATLEISIDGGATWSGYAGAFGGVGSLAGTLRIGRNFTSAYVAGAIKAIVTKGAAVTNTDLGKLLSWSRSRHGAKDGTKPQLRKLNYDILPPSATHSVVITGKNFTGATSVYVGTTAATSFTVDSDTQITATFPALSAGSYTVAIENASGVGQMTAAVEYWSPAQMSLTYHWQGSYSGSPWDDTTSGADLAAPVLAPAVGTAVDGFTPATFGSNTNEYMRTAPTSDQMFNMTSAFLFIMYKVTSPVAANVNAYADPALLTFNGGGYYIAGINSTGPRAVVYDGSYKTVQVAPSDPTGWHGFAMYWSGTKLGGRVDNGPWATTPASGCSWPASPPNANVGTNYDATQKFVGSIMEIVTSNVVPTAATARKLYAYSRARYPSAAMAA